jgi:hypothetical protein
MKKETVAHVGGIRIIIMDSITKATAADAGAVVISASHGGASSGEFALEHPLGLVIFNDAGDGKDHAGIAALAMLQSRGRPAATVAHTSARIGDSADHWDAGVISHSNQLAHAQGARVGAPVQEAAVAWACWARGRAS